MSEEIKPCPCCGRRLPWNYVSPFAAAIECECGIKLKDSCVRTIYAKEDFHEIPKALQSKAELVGCLKDSDDNIIDAYWIKPTDSFDYYGHTKKWNMRVES